jgi:hypothetical protein
MFNIFSIFSGLFSGILPTIIALLLGLFMLGGCTIRLQKDGEFGFEMGSSFRFFHHAPDEGSMSEFDVITGTVDNLVETFSKDKDEEEVPADEGEDVPVGDGGDSVPD